VTTLDILLSYAFHKDRNLVEIKATMPAGSLLMVDSGAYTAWTTGKELSLSEYADYLHTNAGAWDYAISLDKIGDWQESRRNTTKLLNQGLSVVPVYHFGSPLAELRAMAKEFDVLAAGGTAPLRRNAPKQVAYLDKVRQVAAEGGCVVHALGIGGARTIRDSGVWSCDSSTVSLGPLLNAVTVHKGTKLLKVPLTDYAGLQVHATHLGRFGLDVAQLIKVGKWKPETRVPLFAASLASAGIAWDNVRKAGTLDGPQAGPRYFNSLTTAEGIAAIDVVRRVTSGN